MTTQAVRITDNTPREDIAELLAVFNADAKVISRRGKSARLRPEYEDAHDHLNALLTDWQAATDAPTESTVTPRASAG